MTGRQEIGKGKNPFSFTHFRISSWNPRRLTKTDKQEKNKQKFVNMCIAHVHKGAPSDENLKGVVRTWAHSLSCANTKESELGLLSGRGQVMHVKKQPGSQQCPVLNQNLIF